MAPKSWAIRKPELLSLWTAAPGVQPPNQILPPPVISKPFDIHEIEHFLDVAGRREPRARYGRSG